jgi:hypothetical protein
MRILFTSLLLSTLLSACAAPLGNNGSTPDLAPNKTNVTQLLSLTPTPALPIPTVEGQSNTFRVQVNPSLPPYDLKLTINPQPQRLIDNTFVVGWIEVTRNGQPVDKIPVAFHDASQNLTWPQNGLRLLDINFDGSLDIATVERGGAEWGYLHWYQFDPSQGRFIFTSLTEELSALANNGIAADPQGRELRVDTLVANCASTYTYVIAEGHLLLKQKQEYKQSSQGCVQTP